MTWRRDVILRTVVQPWLRHHVSAAEQSDEADGPPPRPRWPVCPWSTSGSPALFAVATVVTLLGAVPVQPIRSIRQADDLRALPADSPKHWNSFSDREVSKQNGR